MLFRPARRTRAGAAGQRPGVDGMAWGAAASHPTRCRRQVPPAGAFDAVGAARRLYPSGKRRARAVCRGRRRFHPLWPHPCPGRAPLWPRHRRQPGLGRRRARQPQWPPFVLRGARHRHRRGPADRLSRPREGELTGTFQYFEDYRPGMVVTGGSFPVSEAEILEFARRYDPQMMHVDKEAAERGEFCGLIASGWHTAAMMMRMVAEVLLSPVANLASPGIDELRWLLPVRPGDVLSLRGTILEARQSRSKPGQGVVKSLVEVLNQKGEVVMTLKPVSLVRCRP